MKNNALPARAWVVEQLFARWQAEPRVETVAVEEAMGRVPAQDVYSRHSLPVVRASAKDGVGVCSALFEGGLPDTSAWVLGEDFVRADTGDDFDDRFDAVIKIEDVTLENGRLAIHPGVEVTRGMNIRPRGGMLREGELLSRRDRALRPMGNLSALVMGGVAHVEVYRRPRVAFIPTGNELIPPGAPLIRGKNYDSNSILVKHLLLEMGAEPVMFPIVPDDAAALESALSSALGQADIVVLNGGSSKGEDDWNARLLRQKGELICHGVAAAPGKPICVGLIEGKPVVNLPGPPMAAFYGFDWCIRPLVSRLSRQPVPRRHRIRGRLTREITVPKAMEILCKLSVTKTKDGFELAQAPFEGKSVVQSLCADGMFVTRPEAERYEAGEELEVELLRGPEYFED